LAIYLVIVLLLRDKKFKSFFIIFGYFLRDSDWNGFLFQPEGDDEKKIQLFIS